MYENYTLTPTVAHYADCAIDGCTYSTPSKVWVRDLDRLMRYHIRTVHQQ